MTGGARERTLASHSRLFRILFPHLTILVHEPPAHLYASVVVLDSLEKSCITKHVRVYLTRTWPGRNAYHPCRLRSGVHDTNGKRVRGCCVDLSCIETVVMKQYTRKITVDMYTSLHYRLLLNRVLNTVRIRATIDARIFSPLVIHQARTEIVA